MTGNKVPPPWHRTRPRTISQQYNHMLRAMRNMHRQLVDWAVIADHHTVQGDLPTSNRTMFLLQAAQVRMELDRFSEEIRKTRTAAIAGAKAAGKTKGVGRP